MRTTWFGALRVIRHTETKVFYIGMSVSFPQMKRPLPFGKPFTFAGENGLAMNAPVEKEKAKTEPLTPATAVEDDFFHPKNSLTANHVIGVFGAGFAATLLALNLKTLFRKPQAIKQATENAFKKSAEVPNLILDKKQSHKLQLNVSGQFDDGLSASYRLAMLSPKTRAAVASYVGTMILGYLGGSLAKGIQEAWVRRQETLIRANLINRLQDKFRQSIQAKQDMDTELKRQTEAQIYDLLCQSGMPKQLAHDMVIGQPVVEPANLQRLYAYVPVSRTLTPGQLKGKIAFGSHRGFFGILTPPHVPEIGEIESNTPPSIQQQLKQHMALNALLLGFGAGAAGLAQQFLKLFLRKEALTMIPKNTEVTEFETLVLGSNENWWLKSFGKKNQMLVLAGFFGMTALAKLGKLFVDGVREVEVTRRNARTEFLYQTHNWLVQDPSFHKISEEEAVKHEVALLKEQLPYLVQEPEKLQERIMVLLSNIGRNSAPKYFPMTPAVNLVDARG